MSCRLLLIVNQPQLVQNINARINTRLRKETTSYLTNTPGRCHRRPKA